jgi:hypothetical protein
MMVSTGRDKPMERAFLVGLETHKSGRYEVGESLDELALLVHSAGGEVADRATQKLEHPVARPISEVERRLSYRSRPRERKRTRSSLMMS